MQTGLGIDAQEFGATKRTLRDRLKELAAKLDVFLAEDYAVDVRDKKAYDKWINCHEPFHWFAEFYGIMSLGGFDVVIGNPPWKEYASVKRTYTVLGYFTERCGNLHGICTERALRLRSGMGRMSFIVQLPLTSSSRMNSVRSLLRQRSSSLFVIPFDDRPGKLFDGLEHCRSTIFFSECRDRKEQPFTLHGTSGGQQKPVRISSLNLNLHVIPGKRSFRASSRSMRAILKSQFLQKSRLDRTPRSESR